MRVPAKQAAHRSAVFTLTIPLCRKKTELAGSPAEMICVARMYRRAVAKVASAAISSSQVRQQSLLAKMRVSLERR